jgi:hypothetical protein
MQVIWGSEKQKYFCKRGWTGGAKTAQVICPSSKMSRARTAAGAAKQSDLR